MATNNDSAWMDDDCLYHLPSSSASFGPRSFNIAQLLLSLPIIVGNTVVIATIRRSPSLHTVPYVFICHLAAADLCVGVVLFVHAVAFLSTTTPYGCAIWWCALHQNVKLCALLASSLLYGAVNVERYVAIVLPLHADRLLPRRRVRHLLAVVWCAVALVFVAGSAVYVRAGRTGFQCVAEFRGDYFRFWSATAGVTTTTTLAVIFFCYARIVATARRHRR
ncbi:PREDICTED: beta-3 adrenergic receptor-like, partial [Priapulus caudatus]|uniref:Beta-3 adrenergic receptor-like n=1 Tax=Priapulus caudatus TaxID=37621 RepID=A0ABM1F4A9_PRICU